jgi:hypothetical protein
MVMMLGTSWVKPLVARKAVLAATSLKMAMRRNT